MKCPKCGYVSFEYLNQCRKCGKSVEVHKTEHGLYGYPPRDLMLVQYLEDKASVEEGSTVEETVGTAAVAEAGDDDLEDIISDLGGASDEAGDDDSGLSLDLGESEEAPEKIAAELSETTAPVEKESGIELTLDDADTEGPAPVKGNAEPEKPASKDDSEGISLSLGDMEIEVDAAEAPEEKPAPKKAEENPGETEVNLEEAEISLDLDEIETDIEIDDETTAERPKKEKKKADEDSGDEITLELD